MTETYTTHLEQLFSVASASQLRIATEESYHSFHFWASPAIVKIHRPQIIYKFNVATLETAPNVLVDPLSIVENFEILPETLN